MKEGEGLKRILVACGQGVATSTMVLGRLKGAMEKRGLDGKYTVVQCKVLEILSKADGFDFVIATAQMPPGLKIPGVNGVPILTGIGVEKVYDQIAELIRA